MINHIYSGTIPDNISDHVADLLNLSHKYELYSLKKACEKTLVDDLVVENAINTIILADRWDKMLSFSILPDAFENSILIVNILCLQV